VALPQRSGGKLRLGAVGRAAVVVLFLQRSMLADGQA
jgi:hypothetical protein